MTKINHGGRAFPLNATKPGRDGSYYEAHPGMSMRDWFAGHALAGLMPVCLHDTIEPGCWPKHIAEKAYEIADAMIAARGEK